MKQVHYGKTLGRAETTPSIIHNNRDIYDGFYYDNEGNQILGTLIEQKTLKINKATTDLNGAYPYTFDFLNYVCTHAKKAIGNINTNNYYYTVTAPWDKYIELTLGGRENQKHSLLTELLELVKNPQVKIIPYDEKSSITAHPIRIAFRSYNKELLPPGIIKRLDNIGANPIGEIQIEFLKPLFEDVVKSLGNSFPMPVAFHATMKEDMDTCRLDPDIKAIPEQNYPNTYRKLWIYLNLHDNSTGNKIIIPAVDLLMHCSQQYIQRQANGKYCVKNWWKARLFVMKGLTLFRKMAEYGHMGACKFSPTGVYYNKPLQTFEITVTRNKKEYTQKINDIDKSPFAHLPYTAEPPKQIEGNFFRDITPETIANA